MKKIISLMIISTLLVATNSCSDDDFSSKYADPNKVATVAIPNLMTGTFKSMDDYQIFGYYRGLGMEGTLMGKFAQSYGFPMEGSVWFAGFDGYTKLQYEKFYGAYREYIYLLGMYDKLDDEKKAEYAAYPKAAMVHVYEWLLDCVDMYADMPYTGACLYPATQDVANSYAKFDKASDIYSKVLDDLKEASAFFLNPASQKHSLFDGQDFICRGDFQQWARYANSLRLRYALRISQHGEEATKSKGQGILKEIIENPSQYPIILDNANNVFPKNDHSDQLNYEPSGFDWVTCRMASGPLIDRMMSNGNPKSYKGGTGVFVDGTDDPRTKILWSMRTATAKPDEDGLQKFYYPDVAKRTDLVFRGSDIANQEAGQGYYTDMGYSEICQGGILWENNQYEHVQITAAEVQFIIAEAYQRGWGVAKDEAKAEAAFKEGVKQSIKWYYHLNEISQKGKTKAVATPSYAEIEAYADARWNTSVNPKFPYSFELEGTGETDEKIAAILTQKWVHFGIFFSRQSWAQLRRTGIPKLVYPHASGSVEWVPDRWKYPTEEANYNPNYPGADVDVYVGEKLFWAHPKGMRHSEGSGATWTDNWGN